MMTRAPLVVVLLASFCGAQSEKITAEWIYGGGPQQFSATDSCTWLSDGTALVGSGDGNLDVLDPRTEERHRHLDAERAAKALCDELKLLDAEGRPRVQRTPPPRPDAVTPNGRRVFWRVGNRLAVMDLPGHDVAWVHHGTPADKLHRFSPDGEKIAFIRDNDLWVLDLEKGSTRRMSTGGSATLKNGTLSWVYWEEIFGRKDTGYWWSPDSTAIAFLSSDEADVTEVTYLDFQPEVPRLIRQRYPKAGTKNPVVRLGVAKLGVRADQDPVTWVSLGDNRYEYIVRAKWFPDSKRIAVQTLNRDHDVLDLWFCDRKTGEGKHVLRDDSQKGKGWVNVHDDLYFLRDGKHFLWVTEESGWSHLYRYTMDGKRVNAVTSGEWALHGANPIFWMRQAVCGIDEEEGWVYYGSLEHDPRENHLYRVKLDGTERQKLTGRRGTHVINMSPDARFFFDEYSNIQRPPELTLRRPNWNGIVKTLNPTRERELEDLDVVFPELFWVENRDGFKMPGYVFKPMNVDASGEGGESETRYPVILYTYGGPSSRSVIDQWMFDFWWNQILVREGYVVCCIDNRSATGFSKADENIVNRQMTGDQELNDVLDAVKWLKTQEWCDPKRVGIWGWSNGGMMTLLGMTRSKEFKAGISVAPVTRWEYYDTIWTETVNKRPQDNAEGYAHMDLTKRAKDLHGRLFLVHGTYDDNVHIQNSYHFVDELLKSGKMFDFMVYPMRKHGIADSPARIHLYNRMLEFWKAHL